MNVDNEIVRRLEATERQKEFDEYMKRLLPDQTNRWDDYLHCPPKYLDAFRVPGNVFTNKEEEKVEEFGGVRYKIFLNPNTESGVRAIHIERVAGSGVFEKMTVEEISVYMGFVVKKFGVV